MKHRNGSKRKINDCPKTLFEAMGDISVFLIGDPHFRARHLVEGEELIEKCIRECKRVKPTLIIVLGDVLDTHEVARNAAYKQACRFIEELSNVAPTFVLMGNHDLINQSQFLTDNHFFNPLKKWRNVTIVDYPFCIEVGDKTLILCPYVPPGRFIDALNVLLDHDIDWQFADAIFAHQEIRGCNYNGRVSENGDSWDESYPPLYSGHIHAPQTVGDNVFYVGSALQVNFDEEPNKRVWVLRFNEEIDAEKIDLGLKGKREVIVEDISEFDIKLAERYFVKIKYRCTSEEFKVFRKSSQHAKLVQKGIRIVHDPIRSEKRSKYDLSNVDRASFEAILKTIVSTKSDEIRREYEEMFNDKIVIPETFEEIPDIDDVPEEDDVEEDLIENDSDDEEIEEIPEEEDIEDDY